MSDQQERPDDDRTRSFLVLTPGTSVNQYRIIEKIGAGGMGEVYLAEDTTLNRRVALKFLSARQAEDSDFRTRFVREAQAAAALNHPNIIHIYEVSEFEGRPFFAMEHIGGQTLHYFAHEETLPFDRLLEIAIQLTQGLHKAHREGIVHRDIKTANIIVDSDGTAKILDFGLASMSDSEKLTKAGSTIGTVAYMSPEQAEGRPIDERSDLFSFGVVLYELIAGRTPFKRDSEAATLNAVIHDEPEPLSRYKTGVPDGLQMIIDKLLDKDARVRYQTAADLLADLVREKRLMDSGAVSSPSRRVPAQRPTAPSHNRKLAVSGIAAVVLIALVLVLKPWTLEISSTQEAIAGENRLAVMYFDNIVDPEDPRRFGEIVTNLLITDLSESDGMRVLSSQRLYDILRGLGHDGARAVDRETASQVARQAEANLMLTGNILQAEPNFVITAQIIDVASGQIEASQRVVGAPGQTIFDQVNRLSAALRNDLALAGPVDGSDRQAVADVMTKSEEAYRLYVEGLELRNKMYRDDALAKFKEAIAADSTFAMAYYNATTVYPGSSEADIFAQKAMEYSSNATPLQRLYILAMSHRRSGDIERALKTLEQIVTEYPDEKEAYSSIADIYRRALDDPATAAEYLGKAIDIDPLDKTLYNELAYCYKQLDQIDKAVAAINRYIAIVPDEPNPYDSRGEIYAHAGDMENAIASYRTAVEKDPNFILAYPSLFTCYIFSGNLAAAETLITVSPERFQDEPTINAKVIEGKVSFALYQGKFKEAISRKQELIDLYRENNYSLGEIAGAYQDIGWYQAKLGQFDRAATTFDVVDSLRDIYASDRPLKSELPRAVIAAADGRIQAAKQILKEVEPQIDSLNKGYQSGYYLTLGWVELKAGNPDSAAALMERAIALRNAYDNDSHSPLALAYVEADKYDTALAITTRFLTRLENMRRFSFDAHARMHYVHARALEGLGRTSEAAEYYQQFLDIWKNADRGVEPVADARQRLARLTG